MTIGRRRRSPPKCRRHTVNSSLCVGRLIADGQRYRPLVFVIASTDISMSVYVNDSRLQLAQHVRDTLRPVRNRMVAMAID